MSVGKLLTACINFCREKYPEDFVARGQRLNNALAVGAEMIKDPKTAQLLGTCPCCSQLIGEVITSYSDSTSVHTLYKLVRYCRQNRVHEFKSGDVKDLLDHTQYANMNHLDRFGGIVYRPINPKTGNPYKSTYYGINLERADEFFRNERKAPVQIVSNRITGERIASTEKLMKDFPGMGEYLDADGGYDPEHIVSDEKSEPRQDKLPTVPQHYSQH